MSVITYSFIPLCAAKHNKLYRGRVLSLRGRFSLVAKFCSWETSGGEQSTSLAWIWVRTAKRLLQLTYKGTLNQWKMSKADFHSDLPLSFFDKPHMVGLASSWWKTSYLHLINPNLNPPLGFQLGSAPEILVWDCGLLTTAIWNNVNTSFFYFLSSIWVSSAMFSFRNQKLVTEFQTACLESLRAKCRNVDMQQLSHKGYLLIFIFYGFLTVFR